jgi:hypothetical protein
VIAILGRVGVRDTPPRDVDVHLDGNGIPMPVRWPSKSESEEESDDADDSEEDDGEEDDGEEGHGGEDDGEEDDGEEA